MNKDILVASYYFPPNPGIGGRRMAKFCKYLVQKGYTVHVISVENPHSESSQWINEVKHQNIKVYPLPLNYPKVLMEASDTQEKKRTFVKRIHYKLVSYYYSKIQKKRIYDPTFLWEQKFNELAKELILKNKINNIIVSVSPHYYAWYATKLKKILPTLNLIVDFRDPWLTLRDFGLQIMTEQQKKNEQKIISETIADADYIISPSNFVLDEFRKYSIDINRMIEVPHAYDLDDIKLFLDPASQLVKGDPDKVKFIYPGTLYSDILPSLLKLNDSLNYLKKANIKIYNKLQFDFFVDQTHYSDYFREHSIVKFRKPIGKKIFEEVSKSSVILILYAEHNKNYRTTKFYEFLPFKKTYLYIGPEGDTFNFIRKNKLGVSFNNSSDLKEIELYFENIENYIDNYSPLIDFNEFSFDKQTDRLISFLK